MATRGRRRQQHRRKGARRGRRRGGRRVRRRPRGATVDVFVEAGGVLLALLGLLTALALLSRTRTAGVEMWIIALRRLLGVGLYVVPPAFLLVGVGVVRECAEHRRPRPGGRFLGGLIAGVAGLGLGEYVRVWVGGSPGEVGGLLGRAVATWSQVAFGHPWASVVMACALLIGLLMVGQVSLSEVTRALVIRVAWPSARPRVTALLARLRDGVARRRRSARALRRWSARFPDLFGRPTRAKQESRWPLPPWEEFLADDESHDADVGVLRERARLIEETLAQFGLPVRVVEVTRGPTVTRFGVEPGYTVRRVRGEERRTKVRVRAITALANDMALALAARRVRVEAPVPGRPIVGIEIPNARPDLVSLKGVMRSPAFAELPGPLRLALGRDVEGAPVVAELTAMPHLLIAGATGSGKSVCINVLVASLLCHHSPDRLKLLLADPKRVELTGYNGVPHLITPVLTEPEEIVAGLRWLIREMEWRYTLFSAAGARHLMAYNAGAAARGERPLPYLVAVIDELADVMLAASQEVEHHLCRLAQMARATGIHLIVATQRPGVDVITGLIKANFPARIAFAVSSQVDSRVILDRPGAETLLGRGDMLYLASDASVPRRVQGCYVSEEELERLITFWRLAAPSAGNPDGPPAGEALPQALTSHEHGRHGNAQAADEA